MEDFGFNSGKFDECVMEDLGCGKRGEERLTLRSGLRVVGRDPRVYRRAAFLPRWFSSSCWNKRKVNGEDSRRSVGFLTVSGGEEVPKRNGEWILYSGRSSEKFRGTHKWGQIGANDFAA